MRKLKFRFKESLGKQKRDIVVYCVDDAREALEASKKQFESALEEFSALTQFDGGDLQDLYRRLKLELSYCQSRAKSVAERIDTLEQASEALFDEWEKELEAFKNRSLRSNSRQQLKAARQQYQRLIKVMRKAQTRIDPVLAVFQDQVLSLKHSLNAQAIAALQNEMLSVALDITALIKAMQMCIEEAERFSQRLRPQTALPEL